MVGNALYETAMKRGLSLVGLGEDKRPNLRGWQLTPPLRENADPKAEFARLMEHKDVGIVLRMSGLFGIESDSKGDSERARTIVADLRLMPVRVEARGEKLHLYFREPHVFDTEEDVAVRIENDRVTGAVTQQFRTWSRPTSDYAVMFENWDAPRMDEGQYMRLCRWVAKMEADQALKFSRESGGRLTAGRRDSVYAFACLMYRWTPDDQAVVEAAVRLARSKFGDEFPGGRGEVERQCRGALKTVMRKDRKLAQEWLDHQHTAAGLADAAKHLANALRLKWTEDAALVASILETWADSLDLDEALIAEAADLV